MPLGQYHRKRKFDRTPEPKGKAAKRAGKLEFVIQRHQASHLHYDFRLELDGVLKSWAVPKGPPKTSAEKRLAMMVEDHPYEYRKFHGTIPEGNYGAGTVEIWDSGTYEPLEGEGEAALRQGLKNGDLKFILHGKKLKGAYGLVHMKSVKQKNAWLLIKKKKSIK
ncbi:MAG TPA: DNA polymerase ligase N-terminal domain-containing protein [Candidatus Paceibacterota bacterium]|nr:DNA polymerase ligase N-terminal domain-containing protein [Candidatus Paceibacterota bacterium]